MAETANTITLDLFNRRLLVDGVEFPWAFANPKVRVPGVDGDFLAVGFEMPCAAVEVLPETPED